MEEIDKYIENLKRENEIKDYLEKDIYPERLKFDYTFKYNPLPLDEIKIKDTSNKENINLRPSLENCLQKIDQVQKTLNKLNNENNECPVCLNEIKEGFIQPSCGHKICISCGINNALRNRTTGLSCCICRRSLI
jgi:hypothetical protein